MLTLRGIASEARKKVLGVRPVAEVPYATHLPVLAALAKIRPLHRVLELGSGPFSTSLFLNLDVFPDLETLVSYEDDPEWSRVVREAVGDDERLDFRIVEAVRLSVPSALDDFDLIFIDDSRIPVERSVTIKTVAGRRPTGLVAVHDFEQRHYRAASKQFQSRVVFKTFTPQVGVLWNGDAIELARLVDAAKLIEAGRELDVTDHQAWAHQMSAL